MDPDTNPAEIPDDEEPLDVDMSAHGGSPYAVALLLGSIADHAEALPDDMRLNVSVEIWEDEPRECGDGDAQEIRTDGGVAADEWPEAPKRADKWTAIAKENIDNWGLQDAETLLLAMQEELGELTQAHLEAEHEDGDRGAVEQELDDLAALIIQMHYRQAQEYRETGSGEIRTDGGGNGDEMLLCRECGHWFDTDMAGADCPICHLANEENELPEEPSDMDDFELDGFGHAKEYL
jgi:rubrerythrin